MKPFPKIIILSLLLVVLFSGINSYSAEPAKNLLEKKLLKSVKSLYLGKHGREYPYDQSALNRCLKDQYQPCLRVYNKVKKARENILSIPDDIALPIILNLIKKSCNSEDEIQENYVCHGSIMALYFYNDSNHDIKIFSAIKGYNKAIKNIIFNNDFSWLHNRANKNDWVNYLESEDISWDYKNSKKEVIKAFLSPPTSSPLWSKR
ncbi:MAG: hypothetical protein L3J84_07435 [Gammaproteobacteria bacterium]|nr:hypothetical protein [Gammaproteobacteria bacterium]